MFDRYDESLTPTDRLDGPFSDLVGHDVLVQGWTGSRWYFVYRGDLDRARGLPDGVYQGTSHRFCGGVIVRGGRVVSVSS